MTSGLVFLWVSIYILQEKSEDEEERERASRADAALSAKLARLLRPESLDLLQYEPFHVNAILACAMSADDRWLAIGGEEQILQMWNIARLKVLNVDMQSKPRLYGS